MIDFTSALVQIARNHLILNMHTHTHTHTHARMCTHTVRHTVTHIHPLTMRKGKRKRETQVETVRHKSKCKEHTKKLPFYSRKEFMLKTNIIYSNFLRVFNPLNMKPA